MWMKWSTCRNNGKPRKHITENQTPAGGKAKPVASTGGGDAAAPEEITGGRGWYVAAGQSEKNSNNVARCKKKSGRFSKSTIKRNSAG